MHVLGLMLSIGAVGAVVPILRDVCTDPPKVDHAELMEDQRKEIYSPGQVAHYTCRPGYVRMGSIKRICSEGKWLPLSTGQCKKKPCPNPGDIEFGTFELKNEESFVFGAIVEYTCDPGYQMMSKYNSIECTATGWSRELPHCEARLCPPVVDDSLRVLSTVYDDEYTAGHVIKLECKNRHKKLNGPSQIFCTSNGTWNIDPPTCKDSCIVHNDKMKQHHIRLKNMQHFAHVAHNKVIQFECRPGYDISDPNNLTTYCNNGVVTYPTCHLTAQLCPPLVDDTVRVLSPVSDEVYRAGLTLRLECKNLNSKLIGPSQIRCTSDGTWDMDPPTCKGPCTVLDDKMKQHHIQLKNNQMQYVQYVAHNEVIEFKCIPGSEISDPTNLTVTCNGGMFAYPTCDLKGQKKACPRPPEIEFAEMMGDKKDMYDTGSNIEIKCLRYYKLNGKKNVKCRNGVWDPLPTCIVPCILNGNYIKQSNTVVVDKEKYFEHNQTIRFKCLPNFAISDSNLLKVKCLNGKLKYPQCFKAEPCILNANYIKGNNTFVNSTARYVVHNKIVEFKCLPKCKISNTKLLKVKCLNGTLIYPKCVKTGPCILNTNTMLTNNITVKGVNTHCESKKTPNKCGFKQYKENETIEFTCLPGYEISDQEELKAKCHGGVVEYPKCFKNTVDAFTEQPSVHTEIY